MSVSHRANQSAEEIIEKNSASLFYTMTQTYEQNALYIHAYANTHTTIHKYLHAYTCKDTYINTYQYLNTLHTHPRIHEHTHTHTHTHPNAHTRTIFEKCYTIYNTKQYLPQLVLCIPFVWHQSDFLDFSRGAKQIN